MLLDFPFFMSAKYWNIHYTCVLLASGVLQREVFLYAKFCSKWYQLLPSGTYSSPSDINGPVQKTFHLKCLGVLHNRKVVPPYLFLLSSLKIPWSSKHVFSQCSVSSRGHLYVCVHTQTHTCVDQKTQINYFYSTGRFYLFHGEYFININVLHNICFQRQEHF